MLQKYHPSWRMHAKTASRGNSNFIIFRQISMKASLHIWALHGVVSISMEGKKPFPCCFDHYGQRVQSFSYPSIAEKKRNRKSPRKAKHAMSGLIQKASHASSFCFEAEMKPSRLHFAARLTEKRFAQWTLGNEQREFFRSVRSWESRTRSSTFLASNNTYPVRVYGFSKLKGRHRLHWTGGLYRTDVADVSFAAKA